MSELKIPSAAQVEDIMIEKDKVSESKADPLDSHATFFYLYMFRFKQQIKLMSKKELARLMDSLVSSEYVKNEDVVALLNLPDSLNLNSVIRVITNAVEFPLNEKAIKSMSKKEKKAFELMDNLLAEKYVTALEKLENPKDVKVISDIIKHSFDEKEFNKRKDVEKDAFATANQLICSKTLLIQYTVLEQVKIEEDKKKDEKN
jgi:hypothetical protein